MKKKYVVAFLATLFFILAISLTALVLAQGEDEELPTAESLGVEDASGRSGTYVEVPVNIANIANGPVLGIGFRVDYDESVLNLTKIGRGDLTSEWTLQLGEGRHTIVTATAESEYALSNGSSGSVVLLNFTVIGSPGDTSPVNLTLIELSNLNGKVGTAPAKNGMFYVKKTIFDTDRGTYPSIFGTHIGTITPNRDIIVHKLHTYSCEGTGGHTEYVWIHGNGVNESASWNGYIGDYQNIDFNNSFILKEGKRYNYVIKTGSYPQIIHEHSKNVTGGEIICTKFTNANGEISDDWVPAIRFE